MVFIFLLCNLLQDGFFIIIIFRCKQRDQHTVFKICQSVEVSYFLYHSLSRQQCLKMQWTKVEDIVPQDTLLSNGLASKRTLDMFFNLGKTLNMGTFLG